MHAIWETTAGLLRQRASLTAVLVGSAPVDVAALQAGLRRRLSPYKVPRRFLAMEESDLPTLPSGKIDLRKLVEIVSGS